ncbi:MAG TPA: patatin-like phospholipase family protein [Solirubrobacterales bacterium]|nr:patatin-like phospholipase family protein [Solirubrobacterales bacterium]
MASSGTAAFLRRVPVLSGLDAELLSRLAAKVVPVTVRAGDWLVREGEAADRLYLIRSGRLEVVAEGPPETVIRVLRRGEILGELALLTEKVRSASVRARRDSELLELRRRQFEELISDAPGFALGLTRAMGAQLAASRTPAVTTEPPRTIGALPLDEGVPVAEAADLLVDSLGRYGSVAKLTSEPGLGTAEMISRLERAEAENERVVLIGRSARPGEEWTDLCVREADSVFALSHGTPSAEWLDHPEALVGCELVVLAERVTDEVLDALRPREVQVLPQGSDLQPSVDLTARRLAGRAIGIVLSGGGARALAHLGVIEELNRAGVRIDRVGGVSLGSVIGAAVAASRGTPEELHEQFKRGFIDVNPTGDYTVPVFSMIRGARTRALLQGFLEDTRIEELITRYFCVSCDLVKRETVVHRTGVMADAVLASLSIPGVFPPVATDDGRLLVDGGVLDNLPVEAMAQSGEGPVIAVDVTGRVGSGEFRKPLRPGIERLGRPIRRYLTGSEAEVPRFGETIVRTITVGSADTADAARCHADLVIQPQVAGVGMLDWRRLDQVVEAGRAAARSALESAPAWLNGSGGQDESRTRSGGRFVPAGRESRSRVTG